MEVIPVDISNTTSPQQSLIFSVIILQIQFLPIFYSLRQMMEPTETTTDSLKLILFQVGIHA